MTAPTPLVHHARPVEALAAFRLHHAGAVLLDVRRPAEFATGRAPGSLNIPLADLAARLHELPAAASILVLCRSGGRAARAVTLLDAAGFVAHEVIGGLLGWQEVGLPIVRDGGGAGRLS